LPANRRNSEFLPKNLNQNRFHSYWKRGDKTMLISRVADVNIT
jgi:hypothetical protein